MVQIWAISKIKPKMLEERGIAHFGKGSFPALLRTAAGGRKGRVELLMNMRRWTLTLWKTSMGD